MKHTVKLNLLFFKNKYVKISRPCTFCFPNALVFKMKPLSEEVRVLILQKFQRNSCCSIRMIAKELKIPLTTVYDTIKRFGENHTFKDLPGRGRKRGSFNKTKDKTVKGAILKNRALSVRDIAKKTKTAKSTVQNIKQRHFLKSYKKQYVPKRSPDQLKRAKIRAGRLYNHLLVKKFDCIVMDDETYVKMDFKTIPGPQFYTKTKDEFLPHSETSIEIQKFEPKVLVWQAICQCGKKSKTFFTTGTINAEIYTKKCLQPKLRPFLRDHHCSVFFWPDLATAHYSRSTLNWYNDNDVQFCEKNINPPNCPELRPIERYWSRIKSKLLKTGKTAKNLTEFKRLWNAAAQKVTETDVQKLMVNVKRKIRKFHRGE